MDLPNQLDLSVCIITLNEQERLPRCLRSLPKGCEVVVVDSGSEDQTKQVALEYGAKFIVRPFDDYASQKNAALEAATKGWIFSLDADEELSPELRSKLEQSLPRKLDRYYSIERRLVFLNKLLRFGKSKDFPIRLAPRGKVRFEGAIHERLTPISNQLSLSKITGAFIKHYSYDDLEDYFTKFNQYTTAIAKKKSSKNPQKPSLLILCVRPWWEFFSRYILRLGFLDGYPGYCYALISSLYGFIKYAKYRELVCESKRDC